ncbi:hypothetical protein [Thioflexithrix psekupsensis]|uniref:hypothetical protein n=1 Tax=Thioflexithrix psekupsensis TaxID=1570016 RepID=UPI0011247D69|nr:hypothetical protein [Thioflexithrix psekupsensis]
MWVEDEIGNEKTNFFAQYADNVDCKEDFMDSRRELTNNLHHYDFLVLDIDLRHVSSHADIKSYLDKNKSWDLDEERLLHEAGFHLFLAVFQQRFPTERICFFTGNINPDKRAIAFNTMLEKIKLTGQKKIKDSMEQVISDFKKDASLTEEQEEHFDSVSEQIITKGGYAKGDYKALCEALKEWYKETFKYPPPDDTANIFIECFKNARIPEPQVFDKKKPEDKEKLMAWLDHHFNSQHPDFPYLTLRRGLLDSLKEISKNSYQLKDKYNEILDKDTFIEGIEWLLKPLHDYSPKDGDDELYLILCDYLSKPFDKSASVEFSPLATMRNRTAHGNIRRSSKSVVKPETVAFLFLLVLEELLQEKMLINHQLELLFKGRLISTAQNKADPLDRKNFIKKCPEDVTPEKDESINYIECFYHNCLRKLPQNHPLYSYLHIAYQQE